jgi:hypothetical protein
MNQEVISTNLTINITPEIPYNIYIQDTYLLEFTPGAKLNITIKAQEGNKFLIRNLIIYPEKCYYVDINEKLEDIDELISQDPLRFLTYIFVIVGIICFIVAIIYMIIRAKINR